MFDHALHESIDPRTVAFAGSDRRAHLDTVLANAEAAVRGDAEPYRIYIARVFPGVVETLVRPFAPVDAYPSPRSAPAGEPIGVDHAVASARLAFPDADLKRVHLPRDATGSYELLFNQPGEPWSHFAATTVWIDQYSGERLAVWDPFEIGAASVFMKWQFPLHNGDAFGLVGRWAVFVTGLLPSLLFGTGVYTWWCKSRRMRMAVETGAA